MSRLDSGGLGGSFIATSSVAVLGDEDRPVVGFFRPAALDPERGGRRQEGQSRCQEAGVGVSPE